MSFHPNSEKIQNYITAMSDRAAQAGVNPKHLKEYRIPLPSLAEQNEIVEKLTKMQLEVEKKHQEIKELKVDIEKSINEFWLGQSVEAIPKSHRKGDG